MNVVQDSEFETPRMPGRRAPIFPRWKPDRRDPLVQRFAHSVRDTLSDPYAYSEGAHEPEYIVDDSRPSLGERVLLWFCCIGGPTMLLLILAGVI